MKKKSLNERLLPSFIAASAALTIREFFRIGGLKGLAIFIIAFVGVRFVVDSFLLPEEATSGKRKIIGVLIFILLLVTYVYLKSKHRYVFFY